MKKKLSEIILSYRETNNMSLTEFAKRVGKTKSFIFSIEKENSGVSFTTLKAIALGMNMDVRDLIDLMDGKEKDIDAQFLYSKIEKDSSLKAVIRKIIALDEGELKSVIEFINTLKSI